MIGYQCPDGTQWNVNSCNGASEDANCGVYRLDLPVPSIGFRVPQTMRRGDLIRRLSGCEAHRVTIVGGEATMGALIPTAPKTPVQRTAPPQPNGEVRTATRQTDWGEVEYWSYGQIKRIGNMDVEYWHVGSDAQIKSIGAMSVEYWNYGQIRRIGNMDVEYWHVGRDAQIKSIGTMNVEYWSHGQIRYIGNR